MSARRVAAAPKTDKSRAREIIEAAVAGEIPFRVDAPKMGARRRDAWMVPGVWMTRSGNVVPIETDHDASAAALLGLPLPNDTGDVGSGIQAAYARGWVRIILTSVGGPPPKVAMSGPPPSAAQRRNVRDWAAYHGYEVQDLTGRYANGRLQ